ncbi:uncharacterized protein BO95DRAFT_377114 [Aspergillus brunneoviolaceus CBS 621.78]|uniref:Uncharacterized protein n=1 Tax=Aspergillus brunneoviolaceus CBS 621.78 TaxID=1450534 RepID=A0ACD1FS58_9EURO|nr:hypothetical protein BO95DRAFT_377114 [Aspergillus brunneoviolaceus CBS 621.78]RAH39822.1 hypothetical protein BO95DRAFT_377114 [Aspergillus brunneoviolaceus CBS 621.78]
MERLLHPRSDGSGTSHMTIAVRVVVLALAIPTTLVCVLRLYLRKFVTKQFGLDDWLVLIALIGVDLFSALAYTITYYGLGEPLQNVSADQLVVFLTLEYASQCAYLVIAAAVKASLLLFIMRLFPTRFVHLVGRCLLGVIAAFTLSGTLALVFQCRPVQAAYDKTLTHATCYTPETSYAILMMQGVVMFVLDVIILILPMRPIWQLQMPMKKRLLVIGLLCIGFTACVAALVRFSTLKFANDTTNFTCKCHTLPSSEKTANVSDSASMSLIWMEIEFNLGLMSGSLSSLRKLWGLRSLISKSQDSRHGDSRQSAAFDLVPRSWGHRGITKKTEILRVVESNGSQEPIAAS